MGSESWWRRLLRPANMRPPRHLIEPRICVVPRVTDLLDEGPSQARLRASDGRAWALDDLACGDLPVWADAKLLTLVRLRGRCRSGGSEGFGAPLTFLRFDPAEHPRPTEVADGEETVLVSDMSGQEIADG